MTTDKHLIIYHAISPGVACDDGFAAYWVAQNRLGDYEVTVTGYEGIYGKPPPYDLIDKNTTVHILDFSYSSEILDLIYLKAGKLILLDHHKTAADHFKSLPPKFVEETGSTAEIIFDMNRSGARLAWDYYMNPMGSQGVYKEVPSLVDHIEDGDLYKFALDNTKLFQAALRSWPQSLVSWDDINKQTQDTKGYEQFIEEGNAILRYYNQKLQEVMSTSREPCSILKRNGLCCNAPKMFASDMGHLLAKESGTFGATWFKKADGTIEWSLRSNGDYDVSVMAKEFGGGGHKNAAGFSLHPDGHQQLGAPGINLWRI